MANTIENGSFAEYVNQIGAMSQPLEQVSDLDPILERIGDAQIVAIGEASHGNHQYHDLRAQLTRRLIAENGGFTHVMVESDQTDSELVDRSVRHMAGAPSDPGVVLYGQQHWPSWMWSNAETVDFTRWLSDYNNDHPNEQISWQGLDRYPLWAATRSVLDYVRSQNPDQVNNTLDAPLRGESMVPELEIPDVAKHLARTFTPSGSVTDAEACYQAMLRGGVGAMNARSEHWLDTIDRLIDQHGEKSRVVIWAHNTHVGDTRGTSMANDGIANIGQLVRDRYGTANVALVGFAGGEGSIMAAHERGAAMDSIPVPKPRNGSVENVLYKAKGNERALFVFPQQRIGWLTSELDHRAIGAVYNPSFDDLFYVPTTLGLRYDALCWYPRVTPVQALHFNEARQGRLETLRDSQGPNKGSTPNRP